MSTQINLVGTTAPPGKPVSSSAGSAYTSRWLASSDFQVTDELPNITSTPRRNWAGNIAVDRAGHPNNTLFFWAFEHTNGSFTAAANESDDRPWCIWLNGYVDAFRWCGWHADHSKFSWQRPRLLQYGWTDARGAYLERPILKNFGADVLLVQNGPFQVQNDYSIVHNEFSWDKLADYIWIDQPVWVLMSCMFERISEPQIIAVPDLQPQIQLVMAREIGNAIVLWMLNHYF